MRLGLSLPMFTGDVGRPLAAAARAAAAGYDGVFAPDHLFPPARPDGSSLEPFGVLSAVARTQPGLRIGTLVTRASIRPAGLLAKLGAALDQLSGGRAILGVGAGDAASKAEHEAFGLPFRPAAERVAVLEETVGALRDLFDGRPWTGGRHVPPLAGPLLPPGRPELWIGGRSDPVVAAAARRADAWNGWALDAEGFRAAAATLHRLADGRDVTPTWGGIVLVARDGAELERLRADRVARGLPMDLWQGTASAFASFVGELADAGCGWTVVVPVGGEERIELVAEALRG
ncbi:MAG TPA: LLM class flavin-dependent oxidoreductase [Actinomycetota bacterium]|nr:LLM class flavin-dependent oxidoreductase [Actinomycetota bacterium]